MNPPAELLAMLLHLLRRKVVFPRPTPLALLNATAIFLVASLWAQPSRAADNPRPNILFCIADDWGWPHAGAYGAGDWIETPSFDRIAREGVLFTNCFTSNPKCSPCRASILTGRNTWELKEAVNHFSVWPKPFVTYPDLLIKAGYHVGYTGKGWGPGDFRAAGRELNPAGPNYSALKAQPPARGMSNNDYARNFIEGFLAARPSPETPFCFWLGTTEPHRAYEEGSGVRAGKKVADVELPAFYPDDDVIRSDMLDYAVEVEHYDTHVGRVIEHLDSIGELDNTIVVMTSDHGMPFPRVKGQIYEYGYHLPLAIRWGAHVKAARTVDDFVNVRDFAPTFLAAAGAPIHEQITGASVLDLLRSEDSGVVAPDTRDFMLIGKERHDMGRPHDWGYPVRAIRTRQFLYVLNHEPDRWPVGNPETEYRNCDASPTKSLLTDRSDRWYELNFGKRPAEELYRILEDPDCVENVAPIPRYAADLQRLRTKMEASLKQEGDLRTLGTPEFYETIEYTGKAPHAWDAVMKSRQREQ